LVERPVSSLKKYELNSFTLTFEIKVESTYGLQLQLLSHYKNLFSKNNLHTFNLMTIHITSDFTEHDEIPGVSPLSLAERG
jgi:hypothetical protein